MEGIKNPFVKLVNEIELYKTEGLKGVMLKSLEEVMFSIHPSTTDNERVFSDSGILKTPRRNKMKEDYLDALIFLRYHFRKLKKNR